MRPSAPLCVAIALACSGCKTRLEPPPPSLACAPLDETTADDLCAGATPDPPRKPTPLPPPATLGAPRTTCTADASAIVQPAWSTELRVPASVDAYGYGGPLVDTRGDVAFAQFYDSGGQYLLLDGAGHEISSGSDAVVELVANDRMLIFNAASFLLTSEVAGGDTAWVLPLSTALTTLIDADSRKWPKRLRIAFDEGASIAALFVENGEHRAIIGVDTTVGQIVWTRPMRAPLFTALADDDGFYLDQTTDSGHCLVALDPCGAVRWRRQLQPVSDTFRSPYLAVADGRVLGFDDFARRTSDGSAVAWAPLETPIVAGDRAYGFWFDRDTMQDGLGAVDLAADRWLWRRSLPAGLGLWGGALLADDGSLLQAANHTDGTYVSDLLSVSPEGDASWSCHLAFYPPSVLPDHGQLLATDGDQIAAFSLGGLPALATHGWVAPGGGPSGGAHPR